MPGIHGYKYILQILDLFKQYFGWSFPTKSIDWKEVRSCLLKFEGLHKIMIITSDEWDAYKKAGYDMGFYNRQCQPNDKQGNGIIEGRNGFSSVGLRNRLDQAGAPLSF